MLSKISETSKNTEKKRHHQICLSRLFTFDANEIWCKNPKNSRFIILHTTPNHMYRSLSEHIQIPDLVMEIMSYLVCSNKLDYDEDRKNLLGEHPEEVIYKRACQNYVYYSFDKQVMCDMLPMYKLLYGEHFPHGHHL